MAKDFIKSASSGLAKVATMGAAMVLAGCSPAGQKDESVDAPSFVSLNPCLDDMLTQLADPRQVKAISLYSLDPASASMDVALANQFAMTGGTAEEVIALAPDYVLVSQFITPATSKALQESGMEVVTFGAPASLEEAQEQIRTMAALIGDREAGEALSRSLADTPTRPAKFQGNAPSVLLWQPGQIVAGETSLVAQHLRWAGFTNYAQDRGLAQADYVSLETILTDPPDILLIAGQSIGQGHPMLERIEGMLVVPFAPELLYCGGPTIPRARARLLEIRAAYENTYRRNGQGNGQEKWSGDE